MLFVLIGGAALLGVVAYLFILGDVKRIELDLPQQEATHAN